MIYVIQKWQINRSRKVLINGKRVYDKQLDWS